MPVILENSNTLAPGIYHVPEATFVHGPFGHATEGEKEFRGSAFRRNGLRMSVGSDPDCGKALYTEMSYNKDTEVAGLVSPITVGTYWGNPPTSLDDLKEIKAGLMALKTGNNLNPRNF